MSTFTQDFDANTNKNLSRKINNWFAAFDADCTERGLDYSYSSHIHPPYIDPESNQPCFTAMFVFEVFESTNNEEEGEDDYYEGE